MPTEIINLTPHPVTIIRPGAQPVTYPACAPDDLPRAVDGPHDGVMMLWESGDGQAGYANGWSLASTGVVDSNIGYVGVEGLPELTDGELAFGVRQFLIVSIVTAIGALASGRPIVDLLIPMGQVRGKDGRIIGATGLSPACDLLAPLVQRVLDMHAGVVPQHHGRQKR